MARSTFLKAQHLSDVRTMVSKFLTPLFGHRKDVVPVKMWI